VYASLPLRSDFLLFLMPRKRKIRTNCPTCKKPVASTGSDFPFCSQRCRLIDLGKWASGQYVVPGTMTDTEDGVEDSGDNPTILKPPRRPQ
jgi:endogenous inhibitor of DNA gyrase (YacG/DUF329 family)